jgi:hypothetical protein
MTGILQQRTPPPKSNPMLDQIVKQSEANVPDKLKGEFLSTMTVGGKLMWSKEMAEERDSFDRTMQKSGNIPVVVAHTVIKIISIIQNESKRKKPLDSVGLAAPIFMAHILQYVESKHGIPVTKEIIDKTGQLIQINLLKMYGVTEQHIQELVKSRTAEQTGEAGQPTPAARPGPMEGVADEEGEA